MQKNKFATKFYLRTHTHTETLSLNNVDVIDIFFEMFTTAVQHAAKYNGTDETKL